MTPQITAANTVIMNITLENATPDFSRQVNGIPPIDTQRAITQRAGRTTARRRSSAASSSARSRSTNDRTPVLHRVPLLGWLFQRDTTDRSKAASC